MRLLVVLVCVLAVAGLLYVLLIAWQVDRGQSRDRWRVETVAKPDGALAVLVVRVGSEHARTIRELPPGINWIELASELRLAREDAEMQAAELNDDFGLTGRRHG